ncbi:MAG: InlB B-repeat-containing protein, partial [Erysipelotrichaceae bacterium]|nr:InlB B-repeat-containing protein [Erysipelotrichaceae bacterium]
MYNPYQRKLIRDMIMNVVLSLFLIVNLLPVNIGARIVAEEIPSEPNSADVLDSEKQNDNENKEENPSGEGDLSGGTDQENNPAGQENNNEENPQEDIKTEEDITGEGYKTKDETPNGDVSKDNTPIEENNKAMGGGEKKDGTADKDETLEKEDIEEEKPILRATKAVENVAKARAVENAINVYINDRHIASTTLSQTTHSISTNTVTLNVIRTKNNVDHIFHIEEIKSTSSSNNVKNVRAEFDDSYLTVYFDMEKNTTRTGEITIKIHGIKDGDDAQTSDNHKDRTVIITVPASVRVYTISFVDYNGTLIDSQSYEVNTPASDIVKPADPTREHVGNVYYDFKGWDPEISTVTGNQEYKATYTETTKYTVSFVDYDNTSISSVLYPVNTPAADIVIPANPTREDYEGYSYTFAHWNKEIADVTADATYKAEYSSEPIIFEINYVLNGGTNAEGNPEKYTVESEDITLADPTRNNYVFLGWTDGDEITEPTKNITIPNGSTGDRTFTANWKGEKRIVTFDPQDGNNLEFSTKDVYYGDEYGKLPSVEKEGYTFAGWYTKKGNVGTKVTSDRIVKLTGDKTFYAHWTANTYEVTFDKNGGDTVSENSMEVTYDSTYDKLAEATREGYTLAGWFTEAEGGTQVLPGDTVKITKNQTLYAHWTAVDYNINYELNGGTNAGGNPSTYTIESPDITLADPSKENYDFLGWTDGDKIVEPTKNVIIPTHSTGDRTYTANWKGKELTLIFNSKGGSDPEPSTKVVYYGEECGDLPEVTREGYTFAGWYTKKGTKVESDTIVKVTGSKTFYAHWTANTYEVIFHKNGGDTVSDNSIEVTYDSTYGELAEATREGYTLAGWFTEAEGGTQVLPGDTVKITKKQTLYAHWTANKYVVTFASNGGKDLSPTSIEVTYDSTYGDLATVKKDNYIFTGWYTEDG